MRKTLHYSSDSAEILPHSCLERYIVSTNISGTDKAGTSVGIPFLLMLLFGSEGQMRACMIFKKLKELWILKISTHVFIPCSSVRRQKVLRYSA